MRGLVRVVLAFVLIALVVSAAGVMALYFLVGREPELQERSILVLRPGGALPEHPPGGFTTRVLGGAGQEDLRSLIDSLRRAKEDDRIRAVLLMPSAITTPYWAKLQELRDAVAGFRMSGKKVIAFLEYGGNREYFLASAADRVYLLPTSPLELTALASYDVFLRGGLDKLGIYPDMVHVGEYKTATNQLTETSYTPEHREMSESLNRDAFEQLVAAIATGRRRSDADVRALLQQGPFLPEDALQRGLVDGLAYEDQLDDLEGELKRADASTWVEGADYRRGTGRGFGFGSRPRIAVLHANGAIISGESGSDPINGTVAGSETIVEELRRIRDDKAVKAIVLRIDSPGGSSTASDVIWRELMITRDEQPSRPLIVSMADLAASGGYYIALPGHAIVAEPGTLTGSIGIYAGKMVIDGLFKKAGLHADGVSTGENATFGSQWTRYSPEQRERLQKLLRDFYGHFLRRVAQSRRLTVEQVDALAQGRVWTGRQAKERGLVDELGGLDRAVALAKARAKIGADEEVELVSYAEGPGLVQRVIAELSGGAIASRWPSLTNHIGLQAIAAATTLSLFRDGEVLTLMPFVFGR